MAYATGTHFNLQRCVPMERAEEHRCASEYVKTKAPILAERLITANMRLVVKIARGYRRAHCDLLDLVQQGNLGLVQAVARYDPDRGVKLGSYAAWWIRAYIMKFTIDNWRLVKAGTTQAQRRLFFRLRGERRKYERGGVQANSRQLAAALDVREQDVIAMLERFAGTEASLNTPRFATEPDAGTLGDSLSAASASRPDVRAEDTEFAETLRHKLKHFGDTLQGRELEIFQQRLLNDDPVTLSYLAGRFGVTRERARQVEYRLKGKIRDYLKREMGDALGAEGVST